MAAATYPVHVDADLDPALSRWLWLAKWLLAIPHYVVLFFLWIAFVVVSAIAFVAILFTGRYPRALFDFNVGVLRWSWRVFFYTYGALGTDRYPPFTLADVPDYPAHFDVEPPQRLSRGLVLVKWWLLAIPHYLVVGIFVGGGWVALRATDHGNAAFGSGGLVGLLVLVAAVVLLFTGRYPAKIFDFVLGMNRWALRVAAYAGLMTDEYPPFRLDLGGHEPEGTMTIPPPPPPAPPSETVPVPEAPSEPHATGERRTGWTAGRVVSLVIGSLLGLASLAVIAVGGVATWATNTQRDASGYLTTSTRTYSTASYAVTSGEVDLGRSTDAVTGADLLGTVRFRVAPTSEGASVFVGVAPKAAVDAYLAGVDRAEVKRWAGGTTRTVLGGGAAPPTPPTSADIWTAQVSGTGTQTLTWRPSGGHWVVVVMNPDGRAGVSVSASVGATVPDLAWIAAALFAVGGVLLIAAVLLVAIPAVRASR